MRLPSFVTEPSTSVAVMVKLPDVAEKALMPPAVMVTSVPVLEVNVTGEDAPEKAKSVDPAVEAIVIVLVDRVKSMPLPSANVTDPPPLDKSTV